MIAFTIPRIVSSLAAVLSAQYPDFPIFASAAPQGVTPPCFFISLLPSSISSQVGDGVFLRDIFVDVVFLQQRNVLNANAKIQEVQEFLDYSLETFLYSNGENSALIRTYERQAQVQDMDLHYQFHIRQRVSLPENPNPMEVLKENNVAIEEKGGGSAQ